MEKWFNTTVASNPLNWAVVGCMLALFVFLLAQMTTLFGAGQATVSATTANLASKVGI